ncbi:hypothetical protein Y032_0027g1590 [Ancylostoma ceylanicum]|uniref:Late endosomal/lysosomal adaptor and MAPK and MTOR activator 5 n=1 Tax=Ancylostoma ceylanicum TaxID=53326 RepID=A0A016UUW6_9BILA|nr:hypothetical protein Y032_0027g1590 [Ancylostoma ceylanicum]
MEAKLEKKVDHLMTLPGITGVCVADSNGLALSSRGSLKADAAPVGSQLLTLCSQIEPSSPVPPQVTLLGDHGKVGDIHVLYYIFAIKLIVFPACITPYSCMGQAKPNSCIIVLKMSRAPGGNKGLASALQMQLPYPSLSSYMRTVLKVSD